MDELNTNEQKPYDQKKISVWIGVTVLILVGLGLMVYAMYMANHPGATMLLPW